MTCYLNFNPSNPPEGELNQVLQRRKSGEEYCVGKKSATYNEFRNKQSNKSDNLNYASILRGENSKFLKKQPAMQSDIVSEPNLYNYKIVGYKRRYFHNNILTYDLPEDTDVLNKCSKKTANPISSSKYIPLHKTNRRPVVITPLTSDTSFRKRTGAHFHMKHIPPQKPKGILVTEGGRLMINTYEDPCKI